MSAIIAIAQTSAVRENLGANIEKHVRFIETAARAGARFILYPEMSLTGYERELAPAQALSPDDGRLDPIRKAVAETGVTAAAGAPVLLGGKLHIGSLIFDPAGGVDVYTKQHLHPGEELFFVPDPLHDPLSTLSDVRISFAICFDIENSSHPAAAASRGASVYAAGIFYTPAGMDHAHGILGGYAKTHSMAVAMSNFSGACWNINSGGRSAFWDETGNLIAECGPAGEALLVVEKTAGGWKRLAGVGVPA